MKLANSNHNHLIKMALDNNNKNLPRYQMSLSTQSNVTNSFLMKTLDGGNLTQPSNSSTNSNIDTNLLTGKIFQNQSNIQNENVKIEKLADNSATTHKLEQEKYPMQPPKRLLINTYKYWEGDNYFPLSCHILYGPCSFRPTLLTAMIMIVYTGLFLAYSSKYFIDHVTVAIPIICVILFIIPFIFLIVGSFTDPGIIRRFYYSDLFTFTRKEVKMFQLGYIRNYKYCGTCGIIRPLRSTHCGDCNNCVERLDHHCPWIGNCVGKRNYKYFLGFVLSINILTYYLIAFSIVFMTKKIKKIKSDNDSKDDLLKRKHITAYAFCEVVMIFYVGIVAVLSLFFTLNLLYYHFKVIINNQTTKEALRKIWFNRQGNIYSRGCWYNICDYIFPQLKELSIIDILREGKEPDGFRYDEDGYRMVWKRNLYYSKMMFANKNPIINNQNHNSFAPIGNSK